MKGSPITGYEADLILGQHWVRAKEVAKCLHLNEYEVKARFLDDIPFNKDTLQECQHTHMLIPVFSGFAPSVAEMTKRFPDFFASDNTGRGEKSLQCRVKPGWHLIRIGLVGQNKTPYEMLSLIPKRETPMSLSLIVYSMIVQRLARKTFFYTEGCSHAYWRGTESKCVFGTVYSMAHLGGEICINHWRDKSRSLTKSAFLGIATERTPCDV